MKRFLVSLILIAFTSAFVFGNSFINDKLDEQDLLLDDLESEMTSIRLLVSELQTENSSILSYSKSLETRIDVCNDKIKKMDETIDSMRKALVSNKEDTHKVINILGDMQTEIDNYKIYVANIKKTLKRNDVIVQILIPTLSLPMIANGVYLYLNDYDNYGKLCIEGGCILFVGAELVWNGQRLIFKF